MELIMRPNEFTQLINPFRDKVFRLAKRLLISTEEAQDAAQEVMMKLWMKKDKLSQYENVEAFAMTVTKNHCLDRLKSKQASQVSLVHSNFAEPAASPDRQIEAVDAVNHLEQLMEKLPGPQRMIIQLRDVEGYEYNEMAEMLNMNETAIRVALSRARKTLRDELIKKHRYGIQ